MAVLAWPSRRNLAKQMYPPTKSSLSGLIQGFEACLSQLAPPLPNLRVINTPVVSKKQPFQGLVHSLQSVLSIRFLPKLGCPNGLYSLLEPMFWYRFWYRLQLKLKFVTECLHTRSVCRRHKSKFEIIYLTIDSRLLLDDFQPFWGLLAAAE